MIGGTSWESTSEYYRIINEAVRLKKRGSHSAKILLYSVDFATIRSLSDNDDWDSIAEMLITIGKKLESAGADLLLLCANTLHKVYDPVQKELKIPVLHIADVLAKEIKKIGFTKVGLLGTRITMESEFYRKRLKERYKIITVVPDVSQRGVVSEIIFGELIRGKILDSSRETLKSISNSLVSHGAQAIVLGCTELPLILQPRDLKVPMFDTLLIHAASAVNFALQK